MFPTLLVNDNLSLSQMHFRYAYDIVEGMHDETIYQNTLTIPSPYFLKDALHYISIIKRFEKANDQQKEWGIIKNDKLVGAIGLHFNNGKNETNGHVSEIGYWLNKSERGQGIMTEVLKVFTSHVFKTTGLTKLTAGVFEHNPASAKSLLNAGFIQEYHAKNAYRKDLKYLNIKNFVLFKDE